jgi:hypothetical protein
LYFACVSWGGKIDESTDGALYLIPDGNWRHESTNPDEIQDLKKNQLKNIFKWMDMLAHYDLENRL